MDEIPDIKNHRPGDALPGNRSPYELASMLKHMGMSHRSFGWASWMVYAANTIAFLSNAQVEKAWREKHGHSVFFEEDNETAKARIEQEFASFFKAAGVTPEQPGRLDIGIPLPERAAAAVLTQDGPVSAPPTRTPLAARAISKPSAEPAPPVTKRATLKKPEAPTGGFFD